MITQPLEAPHLEATMKALICDHFGPASSLKVSEIERPEPGPGNIRVRVRAAGLNFADTLMIQGHYQVKPPTPFTPGMEFAGEIEACGEGVDPGRIGQRVMGLTDWGAFAEALTVPEMVAMPIPDNMSFEQAAAFPIAYGTSHVALKHRAQLKKGDVLLVHGASGGVGLTAVELGKLMGATVIATASTPEKLDIAKSRGADHLINYTEQDFKDIVKDLTKRRGADVIYDPVGGDVFDKSLRCIAWEGRLLVIGFAAGRIPSAPANLVLVKNCSIVGVFWGAYMKRDPQVLMGSFMELLTWYSQGKLNPLVSQTYPLDQAVDAFEHMLARKSVGKLVITA